MSEIVRVYGHDEKTIVGAAKYFNMSVREFRQILRSPLIERPPRLFFNGKSKQYFPSNYLACIEDKVNDLRASNSVDHD